MQVFPFTVNYSQSDVYFREVINLESGTLTKQDFMDLIEDDNLGIVREEELIEKVSAHICRTNPECYSYKAYHFGLSAKMIIEELVKKDLRDGADVEVIHKLNEHYDLDLEYLEQRHTIEPTLQNGYGDSCVNTFRFDQHGAVKEVLKGYYHKLLEIIELKTNIDMYYVDNQMSF